jgi:hypothetical protein
VGTFLDLLGIAVFIVCVIAIAAAVTWVVVKLSPAPDRKAEQAES